MRKPRIIFVHGNDTEHWSYGWAGWFKSELEKAGYEVFAETMPDSILARAQYWLPFLQDQAKAGENDVLVGWSSGATAAMRYAEDHKIMGSVLVAPSYTDLDDEMERAAGYYDTPWQWDKIKANQDKIALISCDNDPYIPQDDFAYIAKQLGATPIELQGRGHFTDETTLPELLAYIKENY